MEFNGLIIRNYKIVKMFLHSKKLLLLIIGFLAIVFSSSTKVVIADNPSPEGNWVLVKDLKVGDLLKTENGWTEIESVEYIQEPITVYNLSVSEPNTFFANGILVHNKDQCPLTHVVWGLSLGEQAFISCHPRLRPGTAACTVWQNKAGMACGVNDDQICSSWFDGFSPSDISCSITTTTGYSDSQEWFVCGDTITWNIPCITPTVTPIITPTPPPTAYVQGRIRTEHALTPYYRRGSSNNCSIQPCPGSSCNLATDLEVTCDGNTSNWTCNGGGAFYWKNPITLNPGCTATNPPAGSQFTTYHWDKRDCDNDGDRSDTCCPVASCDGVCSSGTSCEATEVDNLEAGYLYDLSFDITPSTNSCEIEALPVQFNGVGDVSEAHINIISQVGGVVESVSFSVNNPFIADIANPADNPASSPFSIEIISKRIGNPSGPDTFYTAVATMDDGTMCVSNPADITVNTPGAWCQIMGGDAMTFSGNISCTVPTNPVPPPVYYVEESTLQSGGTEYPAGSDYYYFEYGGSGGDMEFVDDVGSDGIINLGNRKVVIFVHDTNGVNFNNKINVTKGQGFFMLITEGDIVVDPSVGGDNDGVPELVGVYYSDGNFNTEKGGAGTDQQFHVRGIVVAGKQVVMQRSPAEANTPGEIFEYGPDQSMLIPPELSQKSITWKEVLP